MARIRRATIALPLVVVLLGVGLPLLVGRDDTVRASDAEAPEPRVSGRTAGEWAELANRALERGRPKRALSYIKTAEGVAPGIQFADELRAVRLANRAALEVERARRRFGGDLDHVEFDDSGAVKSAHRLVTVLPGESLWTLARDAVAAWRGVPAGRLASNDSEVYRLWDAMTAANGLRELEVGERVVVLPTDSESAALTERRRGELARELKLAGDASEAMAAVSELPRDSRHADRLDAINGARTAIAEAEAVRPGEQHAEAAALAARLHAEETRFSVAPDGTVAATKPPGVHYTDAARQAVEWLLERELRPSGVRFPNTAGKSPDDLAWARYLALAASAAEARGEDFSALLEAVDEELVIRLPAPAVCFAD
jgi:hypothetical protein